MLTVNAERSQPTVVAERSARPHEAVIDERPPVTFEQVVAQQQANVVKLARRLLGWSADAGDVDDVVQDVFLAVLKHLDRFRGQSSVSTWITRIAINACRAHRRKRVLRMTFLKRWMTHAQQPPDLEPSSGERDETNQRVRQAVALLINRGEQATTYVMPDVIGMEGDRAAAALRARGFRVTITGSQPYPGVPAGIVVRQQPAGGFQVGGADAISLEVSR